MGKRLAARGARYFSYPLPLAVLKILVSYGGRITESRLLEELHKVYRGDIEFAVSDLTKALISLEVRGLITTYQTGKERIIELIPQQKRRRVVPPGED